MTRLELNDLPPEVRAKVLAADAGGTPASPTSKRGKGAGVPGSARPGSGPRYRCHACGQIFDRYGATIEKHADSHGVVRLEVIL